MFHATIAGTGRAIPDRILTNADLAKMVETSDEWITSRTGIRERRVASEGDVLSDFCVRASIPALAGRRDHGGRPRHDHPVDLHARSPDPGRRSGRAAQAGREEGRRVRPERRLLGLALRASRRGRAHPVGQGEERPPHRRRVPDPLRGLHRPRHVHPLRRRCGRDRPQGDEGRPRRPLDRRSTRTARAPPSSRCRAADPRTRRIAPRRSRRGFRSSR